MSPDVSLSSSVLWRVELACGLWVLSGKLGGRMLRLKSISQERYMALTALLTYIIDRQVTSSPTLFMDVSLAKNAPSMGIGERLAVDKLRLTGVSMPRENPDATNSFRDHRSDCAPVSAITDTPALGGWVFSWLGVGSGAE